MSNEKIEYLNLEMLHPFENNPFQSVDESEYDELRDSVMEFGIITPLIVNKSDNGYEIISGHRRWQIAKELKLESIGFEGTNPLVRCFITPETPKKKSKINF